MRSLALVPTIALFVAACGSDAPAPKAEPSATAAAQTASAAPSAAPVVTASAVAPAPTAVPEASASAAPSASAAAAAPLVPSEIPSATPPTAEEFAAVEKEIAVRASGEQKCSTKVLRGWFEMVCGEAEGLVRARKVDIESGFDASTLAFEPDEEGGKTMRFVIALPASGAPCVARFWGKGLHEIFLTLENTDKGWKGALSGKRP